MKGNLRRIEDTLNQLDQKQSELPTPSKSESDAKKPTPSVSFEMQGRTSVKPPEPQTQAPEPKLPVESPLPHAFVPPISIPGAEPKHLNLPKLKTPSFTNHRNSVNPALATNLLQEIQVIAAAWQSELAELNHQIQDLYAEGPIVDGWLESVAEPKSTASVLRHAEVDRLMEYIEELNSQSGQKLKVEAQHPGYRLCGLNSDGQVWSRPCPPEQVASLSIAIARHQKLRQFLNRKQHLESKLTQLSETLVVLHSQLKD
jgi:hypothetical protein